VQGAFSRALDRLAVPCDHIGIMRIVALCLLCATTACGAASLDLGFGVAVTATFDSTVTDDELAHVTQLIVSATGDETYESDKQLNRAANRVESFVYRPLDSTRRLALNIAAEDANGVAVAAGSSAQIQLIAGQTARLEITLFPTKLPDAGLPDAGPPDASEVDASPQPDGEVPFPLCTAISGAGELCLDFEDPLPTAWALTQNNAVVDVADTTYAHSGTHAMHVHLNSVDGGQLADGHVSETQTFTTPPSVFHVRAFILSPTALPAHNPVGIFTTNQSTSPFGSMDFELNEGHYAMYDSFAVTTDYTETTTSFPTAATWQCIEWTVQIGSPGALLLSSNGQVLSANEIHDTTTSTPPLGILSIGSVINNTGAQASPAVDLWLDDIVVSNAQIGCSN
jgi:hypothetical protein